jgi:hypothetical protein
MLFILKKVDVQKKKKGGVEHLKKKEKKDSSLRYLNLMSVAKVNMTRFS